MFRIGIGYDIHKLIEGRDLILGGIKITHEKGLLGHSDADSTILLKHVYDLIQKQGYHIVNIDSNIIAQAPKMMPYIPKMKEVLCKILNLKPEELSIKAKTKEKLDAVGQKLAIESNAVVLLGK